MYSDINAFKIELWIGRPFNRSTEVPEQRRSIVFFTHTRFIKFNSVVHLHVMV